MSVVALAIEGLSVRPRAAGAAPLLRGVSFMIAPGRTLVLIGESGSGKSLLAQALFGLLPRDLMVEGGLSVNGDPPISLADGRALRRLWARQLFLIPQEPTQALNPTMTIGAQIGEALAPGARGGVGGALAQVDLDRRVADDYPAALSGGMNQRALAAIAAATAASVIVADEPTKGLDAARAIQVGDLLARLAAGGKSLAVITHDVMVAQRLGGDVAVLRDGRIVEQGPAEAVLDHPRHPYARAYMAALPARWPDAKPPSRATDAPEPVAAVTATGLRFGYPGRPVLFDGLSLTARSGRILAVVGPSGVGKSTLGDLLLGRRKPLAGAVRWGALDPFACSAAALRQARPRRQKLFQEPGAAFAPHRLIRRSFEDLNHIRPALKLAQRLPGLLERLKLDHALLDRFPGEVSGGEAQRLALARILLLDPDFIVADEPTSRLDPIVQAETIGLLRQLVTEANLALVLISHDQALVRATADAVIDLGASAPCVRG